MEVHQESVSELENDVEVNDSDYDMNEDLPASKFSEELKPQDQFGCVLA
jgi:hypothetical protein